ncbi:MAG: hypothetical protein FWF80_04420 [Defluviitaleaceae bacterium]|nr:hypothetical protein [Defluviitaleaceae bacterium]
MQKYFLGVDGGNTKTEYLLCTTEGKYIDVLRTGQCSHENFEDGFDGMERVMREHVAELFSRHKDIGYENIVAVGLGLAGADFPWQIEELTRRVESMGFKNIGIANDGILGIKATSASGTGLCAVNGTGTVVVGVDEQGQILQVGGVGPISGDAAGGTYICVKIIELLYDYHFRCGTNSIMFQPVMKHLGVTPKDMLEAIVKWEFLSPSNMIDIIKIGASSAAEGDRVAREIFDGMGISIGKSAAGCIRRLSFEKAGTESAPIEIVQVGSIWHKILYEGMSDTFIKTVTELCGKHCRLVKLKTPPAVGGIFWAKEIADGKSPSLAFRTDFWKQM